MDENMNNGILNTEGDANAEERSAEIAEEKIIEDVCAGNIEEVSEVSDIGCSERIEAEGAQAEANIPEETPSSAKPTKKKVNGGLLAVGIMSAFICLSVMAFAIVLALNNHQGAFEMPEVFTPDYEYVTSITEDNATLLDYAGVVDKVLPSTVLITTEVQTATTSGTGMGSGFIFTSDGLIITNAHVISSAVSVTITLYDGSVYDAEILGYDTRTDVAVLKIDATGLSPVDIGDSSKTVVGERVVAIGNPYDASLAFTCTYGGISAIRTDYHFSELGIMLDVFQHDAPINSGNSGGPLFNMYGQVIGINAIKIKGYDNIGFAIQINSVIEVIEDIINTGSVQRPTIGISCYTENVIGGIYVDQVNEGSAAEKAGILPGDIITKLNSQRVKSSEELIAALGKLEIGEKCTITVLRDAESITFDIVLDAPY